MLTDQNLSKPVATSRNQGSDGFLYLNDGRVIGQAALQRGLRLRRVAHADVLDVAAAEDDVLVDLVSRSHGTVRGAVLRAERTDCATT